MALYAVVRFDAEQSAPENQVTVVQIVRTEGEARSETERLNSLNGSKGSRYFWQPTRLFESEGGSSTEAAE